MSELLQRWVAAGLISAEQAAAIRQYEAAQHGATEEASRATERRTTPAEAIGYVGAALALGAVALLLRDVWNALLPGGRLTLVALLTGATFGAGLALRTATSDPMRRLTSVLFTASVAGVGWSLQVIARDLLGWSWAPATAVTTGGMLVVAAALFAWRGGALLQLATLAAALGTAGALLSLPELRVDAVWEGMAFGTVGLAWLVLGTGGWLRPRGLAEIGGVLAALLGVQVAAVGSTREGALLVGVAAATALVVAAVRLDLLRHLVLGALALFLLVPQLAFALFGDAIGAPATLLLVGLLLLLAAVGLGRARREISSVEHAPEGGRR